MEKERQDALEMAEEEKEAIEESAEAQGRKTIAKRGTIRLFAIHDKQTFIKYPK